MRYLRKLVIIFWQIVILCVAFLDWKTANKKNYLITGPEISREPNSKYLIYVHWSKDLKPFPGELKLLNEFKSKGIEPVIVLNLDSNHVSTSVMEAWGSVSEIILCRKNRGRDLGGYRCGWESIRHTNPCEVYYLNNSIVWLPSKTTSFVKSITEKTGELIGITDSEIPTRHIQSYGIATKNLGVEKFGVCVSHLKNFRTKQAAITFGEVRLLDHYMDFLKDTSVLYPYEELLQRSLHHRMTIEDILYNKLPTLQRVDTILQASKNGTPLNPSHFFWLELYETGFCGVKKDLFKKNPSRINDLVLAFDYLHRDDWDELSLYGFKPEKAIKNIYLRTRKYLRF